MYIYTYTLYHYRFKSLSTLLGIGQMHIRSFPTPVSPFENLLRIFWIGMKQLLTKDSNLLLATSEEHPIFEPFQIFFIPWNVGKNIGDVLFLYQSCVRKIKIYPSWTKISKEEWQKLPWSVAQCAKYLMTLIFFLLV